MSQDNNTSILPDILQSSITSENFLIAVVVTAVITFVITAIIMLSKKVEMSLSTLLTRSISATLFPTGLILIICSLDINLFNKLAGFFQFYIAIAGLAVLYLSLSELFAPFKNE